MVNRPTNPIILRRGADPEFRIPHAQPSVLILRYIKPIHRAPPPSAPYRPRDH